MFVCTARPLLIQGGGGEASSIAVSGLEEHIFILSHHGGCSPQSRMDYELVPTHHFVVGS